MSLATIQRLGIAENEAIELDLNGRKVTAPVLGVPGHPNDTVTVYLGFGRPDAGRVGSGVGFNAYTLRSSTAPLMDAGLQGQPAAKARTTSASPRSTPSSTAACLRAARPAAPRGRHQRHLLAARPRSRRSAASSVTPPSRKQGATPDFAHEGSKETLWSTR